MANDAIQIELFPEDATGPEMVPDGPNDEGGGNTPEQLEAMFQRIRDPLACPCGGRRSHDLNTGVVGSCDTCDR